jgi:benzoyl-CoA 2,3-dioxygenase component B
MGLKGRFDEQKQPDDHRLKEATYPVCQLDGDRVVAREEAALTSLNERLRDDYVADCQRGVDRWNRVIREHGIDFKLALPHRGFHRAIGHFAEVRVAPDGRVISQAEWDTHHREWLPTEADHARSRRRASSPAGSRRRPAASTASPSTSSTCGSTDTR